MTPDYEPWVLTLGGEDSHAYLQNFSETSPHRYEIGKSIPALVGKKIACASYGWLVVTDTKSPDCFILNIVTEEVVRLPPVDFNYDVCILSAPPTDPACRVVFFEEHKDAFFFARPDDEKFQRVERKRSYSDELLRGKHAIVDGKICVLGSLRPVCIEFGQSECLLTDLGGPEGYASDVLYYLNACLEYIVTYSGDIFNIFRRYYGRLAKNVAGFQVFKADLSENMWVDVSSTNISPLAIFLTENGLCHMCCPATDSKFKPNFIYFFEKFDTNLYAYNLVDGSITMYPTNCGTYCTWMMLPHGTILSRMDEEMVEASKGLEGCRLLDGQDKTFQEDAEISPEINSWSDLPRELLGLVQSRLFAEDDAVFHAVCKSWQQITPQYLPHSASVLQEQTATSPLFMFQENTSSDSVPVYRFFDPIHNKQYRMEIPEMRGGYIQYSRDGWLLASWREEDEEEMSLVFLNPLTKETIKLPALTGYERDDDMSIFPSLSFSSSPTSADCLVAGLMTLSDEILTLERGDESWLVKYVEDTSRKEDVVLSSECTPLVYNGLHYYVYEGRQMGVFDLYDRELTSADRHSTSLYRRSIRNCYDEEDYMVDIDGVPALVIVPRHGEGIRIYRWDDSKKDWEMMEDPDLGNRDMFLSRRSSFLKSVDYGGRTGNKIFLPMLDDAENVVFYSLKTRKYHTLYSGYSEESFYNAAKVPGIWLKPLWTRSGDNLTW